MQYLLKHLSFLFLRFNCGRYFARAEDDGSIDRFITGEKLSRTLKGSISTSALGNDKQQTCHKNNNYGITIVILKQFWLSGVASAHNLTNCLIFCWHFI